MLANEETYNYFTDKVIGGVRDYFLLDRKDRDEEKLFEKLISDLLKKFPEFPTDDEKEYVIGNYKSFIEIAMLFYIRMYDFYDALTSVFPHTADREERRDEDDDIEDENTDIELREVS